MVTFRDCCWVFWMVKGHLNASEHTIRASYDGYFRRLWHNHETHHRDEGFDAVFDARCSNTQFATKDTSV